MQCNHHRKQGNRVPRHFRTWRLTIGNIIAASIVQILLFACVFSIGAASDAVQKDSSTIAAPISLSENSISVNLGGGYVLLGEQPAGGVFFDFDYHHRIVKYMAVGGMLSTQFVVMNIIPIPVFPILLDVRFESYNEEISPIMQLGYGYTIIPGFGSYNYTIRAALGIMTLSKNNKRLQFLFGYQTIGGYQFMGADENVHCFGVMAGYHFCRKKHL